MSAATERARSGASEFFYYKSNDPDALDTRRGHRLAVAANYRRIACDFSPALAQLFLDRAEAIEDAALWAEQKAAHLRARKAEIESPFRGRYAEVRPHGSGFHVIQKGRSPSKDVIFSDARTLTAANWSARNLEADREREEESRWFRRLARLLRIDFIFS